MRDLASIQVVRGLRPIPNADSIECATVLGWHVVVKKNEFAVGDRVVYVEIDSILPEKPEFEFMRARGFRVKTIKLRGQISQGICFPMDILPEGEYVEGDDVSEVLGVTKWEPKEVDAFGHSKCGRIKTFPAFIPKTDETRVQSIPEVVEKYQGVEFYATEKLDGSSLTVFKKDGVFHVCSRNMMLEEYVVGNRYWEAVRALGLEERLPEGKALQGELLGPGVQGNKYKLNDYVIRWFSAFDLVEGKYMGVDDLLDLVDRVDPRGANGVVPIIGRGDLLQGQNVDSLVSYVQGLKSTLNEGTPMEGLVFRAATEIEDFYIGQLANNRVSFKVINPEFLLKYDA